MFNKRKSLFSNNVQNPSSSSAVTNNTNNTANNTANNIVADVVDDNSKESLFKKIKTSNNIDCVEKWNCLFILVHELREEIEEKPKVLLEDNHYLRIVQTTEEMLKSWGKVYKTLKTNCQEYKQNNCESMTINEIRKSPEYAMFNKITIQKDMIALINKSFKIRI